MFEFNKKLKIMALCIDSWQAFSQDFESGSPNFMGVEGPHSMAPAVPCC